MKYADRLHAIALTLLDRNLHRRTKSDHVKGDRAFQVKAQAIIDEIVEQVSSEADASA